MTQNILGYLNYQETVRHNLANEGFNVKSLSESVRHNIEQEKIGFGNVAVGMANVGAQYANIAEQARHNQEVEAYNASKLPYETYLLTTQSGQNQANVDWINAKVDETKANTEFLNIKKYTTIGDMVANVLRTGFALIP